jgi:uncharacterized protein YbjT (DUF2867 family)
VATRNLVAAATRTGSAHLVYVSIVGIDRIASWGYPKTKLHAERIVAESGLPWTILRVTQFYDYCLTNARKLSRFLVAPVPAGFTVQPVDPRDVAVGRQPVRLEGVVVDVARVSRSVRPGRR